MTWNAIEDDASQRTWIRRLAPAVAIVSLAGLIGVGGAGRDDEDDPAVARVATSEDVAAGQDLESSVATGVVRQDEGAAPAAVGADGSAAAGRSPAGAGRTQAPSSPVASSADGRETGLGITDDTITIGMGWFDVNAYVQALAPTAERTNGTTRDAAEAVVRWINERGGIAGRQIDPIYHEYPLQDVVGSNSSRSTREQAMCSDFTEDHEAFAAIPNIASQGVFYECAAQADLVTIATSFSEGMVDQTLYEEIGHIFYMPHGLLLERRERMFVDQLRRKGFFTPDAKVGVILQESPPTRRAADRALFPALEAVGVDVVDTASYAEVYTDWSNMVLRFRTAGVTHVVWGASSATFIASGAFMTASENQGYRPFNALGSDHGIVGQTLVTPEAQRERIVGVSWSPIDNGYGPYNAADPVNANDAACRDVKKSSGLDLNQHFFVPYCDGLFFIKHVLETAPALTAAGFRSKVESDGFEFVPADSWSAAWTSRRHDGASAVRDVAYDAPCRCFRFSGPLHPIE